MIIIKWYFSNPQNNFIIAKKNSENNILLKALKDNINGLLDNEYDYIIISALLHEISKSRVF